MRQRRIRTHRSKSLAAMAAIAALLVTGLPPSALGASPGPVVIGTDPTGDWGDEPTFAPLGEALGQDLVEASVERSSPDSISLVMSFTNLPDGDPFQTGLYGWFFAVGKHPRGLISCGPAAECDEPTNFRIIGACKSIDHPVLGSQMQDLECEELGEIPAEVDPSAKSIAANIPLEMIGARQGSVLKMKDRWILAASPAFLMAGYADSEGNSWSYSLNFDLLEAERNYRI